MGNVLRDLCQDDYPYVGNSLGSSGNFSKGTDPALDSPGSEEGYTPDVEGSVADSVSCLELSDLAGHV